MRPAPGLRDQQRAASEAAILDAAWTRFARTGPDGASLRDIGEDAGRTHALVVRYFASKEGLATAVANRLTESVATAVGGVQTTAPDPMVELLALARQHRSHVQLLVRSALGDVQPAGFPGCLHAEWMLSATTAHRVVGRRSSGLRDRLCAYAASSLVLGWLTFEGFLVAATRLGPVSARRRDLAVTTAAERLMGLAGTRQPRLDARDLSGPTSARQELDGPPARAREALLRSAIELFAEHGPASVSVRDIARHAGANQGLIYRHFGSKEALLAEAIEQGSSSVFLAAPTSSGFDVDATVQALHHGPPSARLIARTLVDDIDISTVRPQFPVVRRLLDGYDNVPTGARPGDLTDPRVVVAAVGAMVLGSVIWGGHLRGVFGPSDGDRVEAAIADLARVMLGWPTAAAPEAAHEA